MRHSESDAFKMLRDEMVDSLVGQKMKQRRNELNLSLRALAAETGLSAAFLSQIECGKSNPSLNSLRRIALSLHVSLYYFLSSIPNGKEKRSELNKGEN